MMVNDCLLSLSGWPMTAGIGAEPLLPKLMAEHDYWRGAWLVILVSDRASQARLHSRARRNSRRTRLAR